MPIYEYTCHKCNAQIEVIQKLSDKPLARHAGCGGKLEKEWSRTGFQFKGTGWYVTDYAGKKSEAKEGEGGKESKDSDSKGSKDSKEAAPAAKTESSAAEAGKTGGEDKSKSDKGKAKASAAGR